MHDLAALRADPAAFDRAMARRGVAPTAGDILADDAVRRTSLSDAQAAQGERKELARQIGAAKRSGGDSDALERQAAALRDRVAGLEAAAAHADQVVRDALAALPNRLDPDVPDGADETANVVLAMHGEAREIDGARQHFELGEALGMDFAAAQALAGARFVVLRGPLARLERALGQMMLDMAVSEHGYEETVVPAMVQDHVLFGTGQLPKFADDLFRTTEGRWLIPTAEVPLTNLVANTMVARDKLPLRFAALTDCFRSEAGAAGRDTRGMLRQHQFRKVEMVSVTHPDDSAAEHERMTACAEAVLERLGLAYRRVLLCAGDTGFAAAKTYDLEVWLPGQRAWREISSCSNTRDFQARRMGARLRGPDGKAAGYLHTLNGSGVAVGRALIAVMETFQQPDGSIALPDSLHPYTGGLARIPAP